MLLILKHISIKALNIMHLHVYFKYSLVLFPKITCRFAFLFFSYFVILLFLKFKIQNMIMLNTWIPIPLVVWINELVQQRFLNFVRYQLKISHPPYNYPLVGFKMLAYRWFEANLTFLRLIIDSPELLTQINLKLLSSNF